MLKVITMLIFKQINFKGKINLQQTSDRKDDWPMFVIPLHFSMTVKKPNLC